MGTDRANSSPADPKPSLAPFLSVKTHRRSPRSGSTQKSYQGPPSQPPGMRTNRHGCTASSPPARTRPSTSYRPSPPQKA